MYRWSVTVGWKYIRYFNRNGFSEALEGLPHNTRCHGYRIDPKE